MAEKNTEQSTSARGSQSQSQNQAAAAQQTSATRPSQGQGTQSNETTREQQAGRGSGALQRRSSLPFMGTLAASPFSLMRRMMEDVDVDRAQARFENGVLEISLPLSEQSQRRTIQIQGQGASGSAQEGSARTRPVH